MLTLPSGGEQKLNEQNGPVTVLDDGTALGFRDLRLAAPPDDDWQFQPPEPETRSWEDEADTVNQDPDHDSNGTARHWFRRRHQADPLDEPYQEELP